MGPSTVARSPLGPPLPRSAASAPAETAHSVAELTALCASLEQYVTRLRIELASAEGLIRARLRQEDAAFGRDAATVTLADRLRAGVVLADEALDLRSHADLDPVDIGERRYGLCHQCGRLIGAERLHALPTATLCLPCEQQD